VTSTETRILSDNQFLVQCLREINELAGNLSRQLLKLGSNESEYCRGLWQIELRANYLLRTSLALSPSQLDELKSRLRVLQAHLNVRHNPGRPL
jgi:hypothetical protein